MFCDPPLRCTFRVLCTKLHAIITIFLLCQNLPLSLHNMLLQPWKAKLRQEQDLELLIDLKTQPTVSYLHYFSLSFESPPHNPHSVQHSRLIETSSIVAVPTFKAMYLTVSLHPSSRKVRELRCRFPKLKPYQDASEFEIATSTAIISERPLSLLGSAFPSEKENCPELAVRERTDLSQRNIVEEHSGNLAIASNWNSILRSYLNLWPDELK